jgi:cation:H+ antiporter
MEQVERRRAGALILGLAVLASGAAVWIRLCHLVPGLAAALSFTAVISAALLISWGAEAAQFIMSQGLAVAIIALLQVLPEFMVEAVIAWDAGKTGRVDLVFANASGSNRLLTGFGWPLIFFVADFCHRRKHGRPLDALKLRPEHIVEVLALLIGSLWYLVLIAKGTLTILDSVILGGAFFAYLWVLNRLPAEDEEAMDDLIPPPRFIATSPRRRRAVYVAVLFVLGGAAMWAVAHPFLVAMQEVAMAMGVSQFVFVQWVAPFLTEFPEKVTAIYWSRTIKLAPMALLNMVSSTVNQFTALVAMIPIAFCFSVGGLMPIQMDPLHRTEIFLSFTTVLYGVACLAKLRFTRGNAILMLGLFLFQFVYRGRISVPSFVPFQEVGGGFDSHLVVALAYVVLAIVEVARHFREIHMLSAIRHSIAEMRRG